MRTIRTVTATLGGAMRATGRVAATAIEARVPFREALKFEETMATILAVLGTESTDLRDWIIDQARITDYPAPVVAEWVFLRASAGETAAEIMGGGHA